MGKYEYNHLQWFLPFLRGTWRQPACDVPAGMRWLDKRQVVSVDHGESYWESSETTIDISSDRIRLPVPFKRGQNEGGRSMMLAHPTEKVMFNINDAYGPWYTAFIPAPASGGASFWIEDNPRPTWQMAPYGFYDKHIVMIGEDGESTELIGCTDTFGWAARGHGRWVNGLLAEGRPVTFGKDAPMSSRMLNRGEYNHVLSLVVRGDDRAEETFPWQGKRLALDLARAPSPANDEQASFLCQLSKWGVSVDDHGGRTGISWADGAQWQGSTLHELDIRLNMFDVVTEETSA